MTRATRPAVPSSPAEWRARVRDAVDDAVAHGALTEEWAGSVYANLDEPPDGDEAGWALLAGEEATT